MTDTPDELRAVAEAATSGPWQVRGSRIYGHDPECNLVAQACGNHSMDDRDFIATFDPPTILAMLDERAADKAQIAALETLLVEAGEVMNGLAPLVAALEHGEPGK